MLSFLLKKFKISCHRVKNNKNIIIDIFSNNKYYNSDFYLDKFIKKILKKYKIKNEICVISLHNTNFLKNIYYKNTNNNVSFFFINSNFYKEICFLKKSNVIFNSCNFYFDIKIKELDFSKITILNCNFYNFFNISYSTFDNIEITNSKFYKDLVINNTNFSKDIKFINSTFYSNLELSTIEVKNNFLFDYCNLKCKIVSISNIKLEKMSSMVISNLKSDNLIIVNISSNSNNAIAYKFILKGILQNIFFELEGLKFDYIEINISYIDNINLINCDFKNFFDIKTVRLLKNIENKKSNYIKALEYQAEETRLHKEELKEQFKEKKNLKTFGDILSIELSSLYSDNGQNWVKAFICTILFPTVFFTLSYNIYNIPIFIFVLISFLFIPLCDNTKITKYIFISMFTYLILFIPIQNYIFSILIDIDNKTFIKELLSYITPTNFNQIILDKTNESYIYKDNTIIRAISYFLGKVLFWYGSVQTVTAFRKFAKGA